MCVSSLIVDLAHKPAAKDSESPTGDKQDGNIQNDLMDQDVVGVIKKPFDPVEMANTIDAFFSSRGDNHG